MDNESSPTRTTKRRKSDDSENNDNSPEPSTSSHSQNIANSSMVNEVAEDGGDKTVRDDKQSGDSGIVVQDITEEGADNDGDGNGNGAGDGKDAAAVPQPPAAEPNDSEELRASVEMIFPIRTSRSTNRARNYRSRILTSSSSSSSSSDSLGEVLLRESIRRSRSRTSERERASSDSNVHTSGLEFELDSSNTSDSDHRYYEENQSSNEDEAAAADDSDAHAFNDLMNKQKPSYTWNSVFEVMHREHGFSSDRRRALRNGISPGFQTGFYRSRHVVEKMELLHTMHKHNGCVNCLNFNRTGNLLCTGSDDKKVIVWDWAANKPKFSYKSGHTENVFQTKFIEMNGCIEIVSTSRDGQIRGAAIPQSGGKIRTRPLYKHSGAVHKLALCPQNPFVIYSAGEDSKIVCCDLRKPHVERFKTVKEDKRKVPLYSIAHHPFDPEICVCGNDSYVRVFDKRNMSRLVHKMCPQRLVEQTIIPHITCCVYNSTGSEILASYSDDDIYLFRNKSYTPGQFEHVYRGHYNHRTIKGVNFFGPNSEYVISGSDCGNIFFWDKNTEAIINFMEGDSAGVVNCLEPHPSMPILATSGLDHNIKIWAPTNKTYPPTMSKLDKCVKKNLKRSVMEEGDGFDDRQFYYFVRQFIRNSRPNDFDTNLHTSNSSSSSGSDDENQFSNSLVVRTFRPSCNPQ